MVLASTAYRPGSSVKNLIPIPAILIAIANANTSINGRFEDKETVLAELFTELIIRKSIEINYARAETLADGLPEQALALPYLM